MLLKSITLTKFLSYGSAASTIELRPLNVIIGPNGSGKSNLIEAIELLRATPKDLLTPIRDGGGVREWLWKGGEEKTPTAKVEAIVDYPKGRLWLHYALSFTEVSQHFQILDERIKKDAPKIGHQNLYLYRYINGRGFLSINGNNRQIQYDEIDPTASILSQIRDPDQYPEITYLGNIFPKIRLYREWHFGRYTTPRLPQKADLPNERLEPDASNLGLALNRLRRDPAAKKRLIESLRVLYDGIDDFDVQIEGGTVQVFLQEGRNVIPATRLSDGTLHYLCLLAVLCHPDPGPLVCIEEPELGLHPDVLPTLATLLKEASERTQLIVTTHSDVLVDALTDTPEAILVAERSESGTTLERLSAEKLKPWLEKYRLGELWTRGDIGGTRW